MQFDPMGEEVRRVREEHAARFHYDLDAIFLDIKESERQSGCRFVTYPPRKPGPALSVHASTDPTQPLDTPAV
jgi:hypothetical protein